MRRHVASLVGCVMLGGLMLIPLAGVLRFGAKSWHHQPAFAAVAASGGSYPSAQRIAAYTANLATRTQSSPGSSNASRTSNRTSASRERFLADDYYLYWRAGAYGFPDLAAVQPPASYGGKGAVAGFPAGGAGILPASRGVGRYAGADLPGTAYTLEGSALRVIDADSDEAIRLGASLIGGGLGSGLSIERVESGLYFGPFNPNSASAGAAALLSGGGSANLGGIADGGIEPVTPGMESPPVVTPTGNRNLDNVIVASADPPSIRGSSGLPSPTRAPTSPYGPAAPPGSAASPERPAGDVSAAPPSSPPTVDRPSGAGRPNGGGGAAQPVPLPAPIPLPSESPPPPDTPMPAPVFGDSDGNAGDLPPSNPPNGGPGDQPPPSPSGFPPAPLPAPAGEADPPAPPAKPPVLPVFIPPLGEAITGSDGALPDAPPDLPDFGDDGPGMVDPPPGLPSFDPPFTPGNGAGMPVAQVDEDTATGSLPLDFGFGAVPEPCTLLLLCAGAAALGRRPSPRIHAGR